MRTKKINFITQAGNEFVVTFGLVSDPFIRRLLALSNAGVSERIDDIEQIGPVEVVFPIKNELPAEILDPEVREGVVIRRCRYEGKRVLVIGL